MLYAAAQQQAAAFSPAVLVRGMKPVGMPYGSALAPIPNDSQLPSQAANIIPGPQACTPDSYSSPTLIDLAAARPGVTQVVDPIHYYKIYGNNGADARRQIIDCAPKLSGDSEFTGYTSFRINWQYSYGLGDNNTCELFSVKVGAHIGMVLPAWQSSSYAERGFADKWRVFMTNLTTHEQGHVALDEQYANAVMADLRNFSAPSCYGVQNKVDALVRHRVDELNSANDNYDAVTDHGATQGAILPE